MTTAVYNNVEQEYPDCLRDESRMTGKADSISFPQSESEIREIMREVCGSGVPVTTQGARTGITGAAVPQGGHVLNLGRMKRVTGMRSETDPVIGRTRFMLSVEPGVVLSELNAAIASKKFDTTDWSRESLQSLDAFRRSGAWFFPPDPTETSASLGGMVACNSSGACTFHYGATRNHVRSARVVLADGSVVDLARGRELARKRKFRVDTVEGRSIHGSLPRYAMPAVKSAAGYYAADEMDVLDLLVGSEGTLGAISSTEIILTPQPESKWGIMLFLLGLKESVKFVESVRLAPVRPVAIELVDSRALQLLRDRRSAGAGFADLPVIPAEFHTCIYVEYQGHASVVEDAVCAMMTIAESCGGNEKSTWTATEPAEMERLKKFRHAVPEAVNTTIGERKRDVPGLTKLGTDMAVPDDCLGRVLDLYCSSLEGRGLEYVMFGHIGNNHVHVNIMPRDMKEYAEGKRLYLEWAGEVLKMGGTVSAEHGIGKLKVAMLEAMYGTEGIGQMRAVRRLFDPHELLCRGNLWRET